MQGGEVQ